MARSRGSRKKLHVPSIREVVKEEIESIQDGIQFFNLNKFLSYIGPLYRQKAFENGHYGTKYTTHCRESKIDVMRLQTIAVATLKSLGCQSRNYGRMHVRIGRYGHRFKKNQHMWFLPGYELPPSQYQKWSNRINLLSRPILWGEEE